MTSKVVLVSDSLPLLLEDGSSLDWPDATYKTDMTVGVGHAIVRHHLSGASSLRRMVESGMAAWGVEFRCPQTLMARTVTSSEDRHKVEWKTDDVYGELFLVPGLLTLRTVLLDSSELSPIWQGVPLEVPPGWWLAKGDALRANTLLESLLKFNRAEDLKPGRMEVVPDESSGRLHFAVRMAPDVFDAVPNDRTLQVAALVGACGLFPRVFGRRGGVEGSQDDDPTDEEPLAQELRARMEEAQPGVVLWNDPNGYDPALAATLLEPFRFPMAEVPSDDE